MKLARKYEIGQKVWKLGLKYEISRKIRNHLEIMKLTRKFGTEKDYRYSQKTGRPYLYAVITIIVFSKWFSNTGITIFAVELNLLRQSIIIVTMRYLTVNGFLYSHRIEPFLELFFYFFFEKKTNYSSEQVDVKFTI